MSSRRSHLHDQQTPGPNGQIGRFAVCPYCDSPTYASDFRYRLTTAPTAWVQIAVRYDRDRDVYYCDLSPSTRSQKRSFKDLCVKPWIGRENFVLKPRYDPQTGHVNGLIHVATSMEVHDWLHIVRDLNPRSIDPELAAADGQRRDVPEYGKSAQFVFCRVFIEDGDGGTTNGLRCWRWVRNRFVRHKDTRTLHERDTAPARGRINDRCPNHQVYAVYQFPRVKQLHDATEAQLNLMQTPSETPSEWVPVTASYYDADGTGRGRNGSGLGIRTSPIVIRADTTHIHAQPVYNIDRWSDLQTTPLIGTTFCFLMHPGFKSRGDNVKITGYSCFNGSMGVEGWCTVAQWMVENNAGLYPTQRNDCLRLKARRVFRPETGHVIQLVPMDDEGDGEQWDSIREVERRGLDVSRLVN